MRSFFNALLDALFWRRRIMTAMTDVQDKVTVMAGAVEGAVALLAQLKVKIDELAALADPAALAAVGEQLQAATDKLNAAVAAASPVVAVQ